MPSLLYPPILPLQLGRIAQLKVTTVQLAATYADLGARTTSRQRTPRLHDFVVNSAVRHTSTPARNRACDDFMTDRLACVPLPLAQLES